MSQDNVKIVREIYDSFNSGQITRALDVFDPDVEWRITPTAGPAPGSYRGHEGVRDAMGSMLDVWREYQSEPLEFIESGECVMVRIRTHATGRASGIELEDEVAHVWRIRDGKVVSFEAHLDRATAVEAMEQEALR